MDIERLYKLFEQAETVQTDTRQLKHGQLFFALKGPNFNGNHFAEEALKMGAVAVVIDEPILAASEKVFLVPDALMALQELANFHRKQFDIPFLAITGSNGKTTTKELIHAVVAKQYNTYTTKGNLNNHIGVPLTILSIKKDAQLAIIEMGANHQKEIEAYCKIALPTHGLITNCGKAHMEGFGGVEGVRKGKGELYDFIFGSKGTIFLNGDLDYLEEMAKKIANKVYYGNTKGNFHTQVIQSEPLLVLQVEDPIQGKQKIFTRLVGTYNKPNVEAAICIGKHFQVPFDSIREAIERYNPDNARSQLISRGNNRIILDAYNANPSSMEVAIENFSRQPSNNKYLFLGGMMELGDDSVNEHQQLIRQIESTGIKNVVLVGGDFAKVNHRFLYFEDAVKAADWVKENQPDDALILIKGSRSTRMERLLEVIN